MYLSELNQIEGRNFLELVYKVANYDVAYQAEEIRVIKKFKKELGIDIIPSGSNVDDLIRFFAQESAKVQKIVYFETLGMILADEKITEKEKDVIAKMEANFTLSDEEVSALKSAAEQLEAAFKAANTAIS